MIVYYLQAEDSSVESMARLLWRLPFIMFAGSSVFLSQGKGTTYWHILFARTEKIHVYRFQCYGIMN